MLPVIGKLGQFTNITVQFFAKKHHFQIRATKCWYNRQLEGPLQKANAAVRLLSS